MSSLLTRYDRPPSEVSILLTTDAELAELNQRFRGIEGPTDVLTFPGGEFGPLGDVAISVDTAVRQAEARGDSLANELIYLTLHGGLHLLGHEDETDAGRDEMVVLMNEHAASLGLKPDPNWSSLPHGDA